MKRIKTLGVAVTMALALTAVLGAASASANLFKVGVEPAKWNGSISGKSHQLIVGETFECSAVSFTGETKIKSFKEQSVTPELNSCLLWGTGKVGWTMNGCKFRFHAGPGPFLAGTMDIVGCEKPMSMEFSSCRIEIGNQSGLGSVSYGNVASSPATLTANATLKSITYTSNGCFSKNGTFNDGVYVGAWTIKSFALEGGQAAAEIESTSAAPFSAFSLEEAPASIAGAYKGGSTLMFSGIGGNGMTCKQANYSGSSSSTTPGTLTVVPTYKECTVGGESVPDSNISAGSCSYVLHANGGFDIAGASCASNPITIARAGCVVTVGPSSGSKGLTFLNEGSGKLRTLSVPASGSENSSELKGLNYTAGAGCAKPGTWVGGALLLRVKLSATNSGGAVQGLSVE